MRIAIVTCSNLPAWEIDDRHRPPGKQRNEALARKGIKIKELAGELGVTSRQLIDRCRAEGLWVQNSVTRLPPADVRRVRAWFAEDETSETGSESE